MKVATGTVSNGRIVVEGDPFSEGEKVTVLGSQGNGETFPLSPEEKKQHGPRSGIETEAVTHGS
jgi:hypothetical protein